MINILLCKHLKKNKYKTIIKTINNTNQRIKYLRWEIKYYNNQQAAILKKYNK